MKKIIKTTTLLLLFTLMATELGRTGLAAESLSENASAENAKTEAAEVSEVSYEAAEVPEVLYESAEPEEASGITDDALAGVETAQGITEEMCEASYWYDKNRSSRIDINEKLMTMDEIAALNRETLSSSDANMYDLENMALSYDADKLLDSLAKGTTTTKKTVFVDGAEKDGAAYYQEIADTIKATGYTGKKENSYAITVRRTTIRNIPVDSYIGYTAEDNDDEKTSAALLVNEPFVIRQKAEVGGKTFYWGYSDNCTGWVDALDLAICGSKAEWLDAWKIAPASDDFIIVTQNQITLEPSLKKPELSEVKLTFSTILKCVSENDIPESVGERGPWNNYVVYLPVRDDDGKYIKSIALISQHYEVSTGYLPLTQAEVLRVAFNNLGDRYGWGGMLDSMDCSLFTRNVYRCFGLYLPRNTNWQQAVPGRKIDISKMSDEEKLEAIRLMPAGTLLYLPGHTMIYTGTTETENGPMSCVISDSGSVVDSTGELKVRTMYSVIINPLSLRRKTGATWISSLTAAVLPISESWTSFVKSNIPEPLSGNRVPASEGQAYASSRDTLPLETFLQNTGNIYLSCSKVEGSDVDKLTATVIKGSKVTTKAPVSKVTYDKGVAKHSISKANGLATVTLSKTGPVSFEMTDGKTYVVYFTVQSPKAQTKAVNQLIKNEPSDTAALDIGQLFDTQLDRGTLSIVSKKKDTAYVQDNKLYINTKQKNSVKLSYKYLNKKYTMTVTVN